MRIEIDHLTLRYGETTAIDDLSVTLDGHKIYGLLGRNGSGKTSLLSVLAAFRKAGIDFAFPTQTLHLASDPERELAMRITRDNARSNGEQSSRSSAKEADAGADP
jgi:ATPase subunit of ABC transporter with duplicated ATPase domains